MLTTLGTRLTRPTAKVAFRLRSPARVRFTTGRAAARAQGNGDKIARFDGFPRAFGLSRRPSSLATELFPAQVGSIFRDIEDELSRLWGSNEARKPLATSVLGAADIQETSDSFRFKLDTPGLAKQDIQVRVTPDNVLIISGERSTEETKDEDGFRRIERSSGKFLRRFTLPDTVDARSIRAEVQNGELLVVVPKSEGEKRELLEIEIQDAPQAAADTPGQTVGA